MSGLWKQSTELIVTFWYFLRTIFWLYYSTTMANLSMTMDDEYLTTKALAILQIKPQKFQILYESGHYAKVHNSNNFCLVSTQSFEFF